MNRQEAARMPRGEAQYAIDAQRDLSSRGFTSAGQVYVRCTGTCGHTYHFTNAYALRNRVTRYMVCERPNGVTRESHAPRMPMRYGQKSAGANPTVRVATIATARDARVRALA